MKIRIRAQKRFILEDVLISMALFFVSSYALLEHVSISIPQFSSVKFPLLYAGGLCVLYSTNTALKSLRKKKFFYIFGALFVFCVFLMLSAYNNRNSFGGTDPMRATIRLVLFLTELFFLMMWIAETGKGRLAIRFLFRYVLILVLITDFLLLSRLIVFHSGKFETYLVGTKFIVSYLHMDLLVLWYINNNGQFYFWQKSKVITVLAVVIIMAVSVYIDCITGVLGCFALVCLFVMMNTTLKKETLWLCSPGMFLSCLTVCAAFPFLSESIVSIPIVRYLLENVLQRSHTLTGRVNIFRLFGEKMQGHWLGGFGFGNGNVAAVELFGYANAQNAVLNWILQSGLLATAALVGLMLIIFWQLSKSNDKMKVIPLVALIYVYVFMGAVETTFIMSFIMWLALLFMQITEKR